jgi:metallo-beta-lactamase class B
MCCGDGRRSAVADGQKLLLGDTTVDLYIIHGHAPGTLSVVFAAKEGSLVHRVLLWGGTAFTFGKNALPMRSYIASTMRMAGVVARDKFDVILSNHASYDGSLERMAKLAMRQLTEGGDLYAQGRATPIYCLEVAVVARSNGA